MASNWKFKQWHANVFPGSGAVKRFVITTWIKLNVLKCLQPPTNFKQLGDKKKWLDNPNTSIISFGKNKYVF